MGDQSGVAEPQTLRTERLEGAQRERIWASAEAHESDLSVRQIASATGLSSSRDPTPGLGRGPRDPPVATVSSVGGTDPTNHARRRPHPRACPTFRPALRARWTPAPVPRVAGTPGPRGAGRGEPAALRPIPRRYVAFDRPRVLRVLARIIADLDELAGFPPIADEEQAKVEDAETRRARHRRRLAEPVPPPKRLTMREERAALRALVNLPPTERG